MASPQPNSVKSAFANFSKNFKAAQQQSLAARALQQQSFMAAMRKPNLPAPVPSPRGRWHLVNSGTSTTSTITSATTANNYVYFSPTATGAVTSPASTSLAVFGTGTVLNNVANSLYASQDSDDIYRSPLVRDSLRLMGECSVADGESARIKLPDGSIIDVARDCSFIINDKDANVVYRANRIRDFNPFINVSDRIEDFIRYCGGAGVRQGEMLEIPIKLFIGWLVLQAAKHDKEPEPDLKLLPDLRKRAAPHCPSCGRFIAQAMRKKKIEFCAPVCFERHYNRALA